MWEQHADAMRGALAQHDELLRRGVESHGGSVVKTTGDGVLAVFEDPASALAAARGVQHELGSAAWGDTGVLRVRMAVHCGPAIEREGDYFGTTLNRAARLMALAHGGQIVASEAVALLVREVTLGARPRPSPHRRHPATRGVEPGRRRRGARPSRHRESRRSGRITCPPRRRAPRPGCDHSARDRRAPSDRGELTRPRRSTRYVRVLRPPLTWGFSDGSSARCQVDEAYHLVPGQGG